LTVGQFEAWMREALIKIHKDATGRGPQDAYVRLFKNCIVFCLEDTLTALERQLLNSGWGEEEIGQLRFNLLKEVIIPRVQEKITEKVPANILDAADHSSYRAASPVWTIYSRQKHRENLRGRLDR